MCDRAMERPTVDSLKHFPSHDVLLAKFDSSMLIDVGVHMHGTDRRTDIKTVYV